MTVYALPLLGGRFMEVDVDIKRWSSDPSEVDFYDLTWVVRSGPGWPQPIGISIHRRLWDTHYFETVSQTSMSTMTPYRIYLYESVLEALWADPDYWKWDYYDE